MSTFADVDRERPAVIMGASGAALTYGELEDRSARFARVLRQLGLRRGDHYAVFMENNLAYHEVVWAGMRSGLYVTAINSHLTPGEAAYIVHDCGARVLVTSAALGEAALAMVAETPGVEARFAVGGGVAGHLDYGEAIAAQPSGPLGEEQRGMVMLYSSGTTGRPKGVKFPLPPADGPLGEHELARNNQATTFAYGPDTVYLSPAPLYHSAPLRVSLAVQTLGGTVVVMEKFDAELALALIERERVTHSQWVPTMFVRMLKLPEEVRSRYDLSSHRIAVHAAAPCPVEVKEQMLAWWGPIINEYYSGTENIGTTTITAEDWLAHKGSVGQAAVGTVIHICDDEGRELGPGAVGTIYMELPGATFEYHGQKEKTGSVRHPEHESWRTLGDIGHLDEDGYLYLTDRKAFMIISGGVNIYPQEIEDVLLAHPKVLDAAVFGVPNDEMGQEVKAVVQPLRFEDAGPGLEGELRSWCTDRLAGYKRPRSYDFEAQLPRLDNGKLYKTALRDRYWEGRTTKVM